MNKLCTKWVSAIPVVAIVFGSNVAMASNFVTLAGKTNDGSSLAFDPNSVTIQEPDSESPKAGDFYRFFNYTVIRKDGSQSVNLGASTPWCRLGKVQLDPRAIDKQVFFLTKLYNNIDILKTPGWFADSGYVVANSSASKNLLKAICSS